MTPWVLTAMGVGAVASATVLIAAGAAKVPNRRTFASQIKAYEIIPARVVPAVGQVLPLAEIASGIAILVVPRIGGALSAALFAAFTAAVASNLLRGRTELVCGCFGARGRQTISFQHAVMTAALTIVCAVTSVIGDIPTLGDVISGLSLVLIVAVAHTVNEVKVPIIEAEER